MYGVIVVGLIIIGFLVVFSIAYFLDSKYRPEQLEYLISCRLKPYNQIIKERLKKPHYTRHLNNRRK